MGSGTPCRGSPSSATDTSPSPRPETQRNDESERRHLERIRALGDSAFDRAADSPRSCRSLTSNAFAMSKLAERGGSAEALNERRPVDGSHGLHEVSEDRPAHHAQPNACLVVRYALGLTAARPLYTYTSHLHLQNTHATGVRILVYSFPPVEEAQAPPLEL